MKSGQKRDVRMKKKLAVQFGGARLLTSRLARTLAPPKIAKHATTKKKLSCCPNDGGTIVRNFHITDYDGVVALWRCTEGVGLNESDTRRAIAAYLRRNPRMSFVAERDGRIIGAVLCGHDGRRGYLHHLAVSKRHRQRGLGRQLADACLAKLRQAGIQRCNIFIFANNAAGMKFWAHIGWKLRTELRLMQIRLEDDCCSKRDCPC
ncbi:MAG TPA: GNAT family N-acetyltransferase [Verrucomicrobiae bacterium]|nr:GNAT family N-acetyltransferase [Verrucomicrobiae bacterium]